MVETTKWLSIENVIQFEVRIGDINYGGHMGNDKALLIFQDARIGFLESLGFSEKNLGDHTGIIMSEAHVFFKKEVFLHDQLTVDVSVTEVTTSSFVLIYTVRRLEDNTEVLSGTTKQLAFNYDRRKVVRIPELFRNTIHLNTNT
ncbi:MAG: thioesterase family protein [Bacteroidetes bacterium]|nr:thioesterase family protein [Bacteroidota bacterium]